MCLAVPMKIQEILPDRHARLENSGVSLKANLKLLPEAQVGDYVIVHAGYAIEKLDPEEAARNLAILDEMARELNRPEV